MHFTANRTVVHFTAGMHNTAQQSAFTDLLYIDIYRYCTLNADLSDNFSSINIMIITIFTKINRGDLNV